MKARLFLPLSILFLAALVGLSLCVGTYPVPVSRILAVVARLFWPGHQDATPPLDADTIVIELVRLPRVMLATCAGAGLGLSGAVLQGLLRNPLVGPDIVGVSSGAACGGVIAIVLGLPEFALVGCAFAGGMIAIIAAAALARAAPGGTLAVVLAGVIVGAFGSALLSLIEYAADPITGLPNIIYWLLGSLAGADRIKVTIVATTLAVAGSMLIALRWRLNLLSLGDDDARSLGLDAGRARWFMIVLVALIVAAQVSVSGIIGWVGLIVPHVARMMVGSDHRRLLPTSTVVGAAFLLIVDDLTRVTPGQELPIGLLCALIGTPIFALLFWRTRARGWQDG